MRLPCSDVGAAVAVPCVNPGWSKRKRPNSAKGRNLRSAHQHGRRGQFDKGPEVDVDEAVIGENWAPASGTRHGPSGDLRAQLGEFGPRTEDGGEGTRGERALRSEGRLARYDTACADPGVGDDRDRGRRRADDGLDAESIEGNAYYVKDDGRNESNAIPSSDVKSEWAMDLCVNPGLIREDVECMEARVPCDSRQRHRPTPQIPNRDFEKVGKTLAINEAAQKVGGGHDEGNPRGGIVLADAASGSDDARRHGRELEEAPTVGASSDGRAELLAGGPLTSRGLEGGAARGAAPSGARGLVG